MYFYLPLEKGWAHHLNKFESPSPKEATCMNQVWLTLVQSFLRRRFFLISSMYFLLFRNYLPLEKGGAFHLNKLDSPSPKDALCQVWLKFYPLGVWRWKCEKFTTTPTTTTTDNWQILIRKAHLSLGSGELKNLKKRSCIFLFWMKTNEKTYIKNIVMTLAKYNKYQKHK